MEFPEFKYKSKVTNILPNTKRTQDLLKKQREEDEKRIQEQLNVSIYFYSLSFFFLLYLVKIKNIMF